MAKEPRPGEVKTRLAAELGDECASALCAAFLRDTLEHLPRDPRTARALFFFPPTAADYFRSLDGGALLLAQPSSPFGERLRSGFEQLFATGHSPVVFIGSDTPHLGPAVIEAAFDALAGHEIVLGPCRDGGYFLIGLVRPTPELFEGIPWSTPEVLEVTRARAKVLGLELHELPLGFDVDDVSGLRRLEVLIADNADLCPATAARLKLGG